MSRGVQQAAFGLLNVLLLPLVLVLAVLLPKRRTQLIWGPLPIINNKYWSRAMREVGHDAKTLMWTYYSTINRREDYDLYFEDLVPRLLGPRLLRRAISPGFAFLYVLRHARVIHTPFTGGPLGLTPLWRLEAPLLKLFGIRTVVTAYGSDAYRYSTVLDTSLRHGLLLSYPDAARREAAIAARVAYWNRHADIVLVGLMVDGAGRWDVPMISTLHIDARQWAPKAAYSDADGRNGPVSVLHTPNHRGFKGSEFLARAVEELRAEGLQIELVLLEKVPNEQVRERMAEVDILAEQFIATGYAMSGLEGMASGLPVMANLEHEDYTRLYRRYSFLDECPVLSTSPETIKRNLRALVTQPALRRQLGEAGRAYVEKYHSYEAAQRLFGAIYSRILDGAEIDLLNLYHPLKGGADHPLPRVAHPLVESRLPPRYMESGAGVSPRE